MAVAPLLQHDIPTAPSDGNGGNGSWAGLMAPCVERAEKVRSSLEQAIDLKPALEACRVHTEDLVSHANPIKTSLKSTASS